MEFTVSAQLLATTISGIVVLLAGGIAWGSLTAQMRGVHKSLDGLNGTIEVHRLRLDYQGQRVAHLQGVFPHLGTRFQC